MNELAVNSNQSPSIPERTKDLIFVGNVDNTL